MFREKSAGSGHLLLHLRLFCDSNESGHNVLVEVLTRRFKGIIVCDGWKSYVSFTNRLQRCWAHLLRESKYLSEKFEEAIRLHKALKELYESLTKALEKDPPPEVRMNLWHTARETLLHWIGKE